MAKGHKTPGSGRKKGTPNKNTVPAEELAKKLGIDPLEVLLLIAKKDWKRLGYNKPTETRTSQFGIKYEVELIPLAMRMAAADCAVEYIRPKRKAIEHTGEGGGPLDVDLIFETQWRDASENESGS